MLSRCCPNQVLGPAKVEKDPRIVDHSRQKVLVLHKSQWQHYIDQLTPNKKEKERVEAAKEYIQYLKDGSAAITANWKDNKKNRCDRIVEEKERAAREKIENLQKSNKEWREFQEARRDEYVDKIEKILDMEQIGPRQVTWALMHCHTLYERLAQQALNKKIAALRGIDDKKLLEEAKQEALDKAQDEKDEIARKRKKETEYKAEMMKGIIEKKKREEKERHDEMCLEREDQVHMALEIKRIAAEDKAELERKRAMTIRNNAIGFAEKKAQIAWAKRQDELEQAVVDAQAIGQCHIEQMKREKVVQDRIDKAAFRNEQIMRTYNMEKAEEENLDHIVNAAYEENNRKLDAIEQAKIDKADAWAAERNKINRDLIRANKKKACEEDEQKRWGMLNRFKQTELTAEFKKRYEDRKLRLANQRKAELLADIREKHATAIRNKVEFEADIMSIYRHQDKVFLDYAAECIEDCKKVGRPTYPLVRLVADYKKQQGLVKSDHVSPNTFSQVPMAHDTDAWPKKKAKKNDNRGQQQICLKVGPACICHYHEYETELGQQK